MQLLRNVVLGWLPWADVEDVSLSSNEGSWEVALRATIAIHGYGRPEGKDGKTWVLPGLEPVHLVFPNNFVGTLGATYASRGARESALAIATTMQYHVHRRVELPAGLRSLPTVLLDARSDDETVPAVVPDEVAGGRSAVEELIAHGHRRIGFAQNLDDIHKRLYDSVWSFVKNLRARRGFDGLQSSATLPAFRGEKSAKAE